MSKVKKNIKETIQDYLLDEGLLRKRITEPKLEFGFQFTFPPGSGPPNRSPGQNMVVFQPKNKRDLLIITVGTQISKPHVDALNKLGDKKVHFFMDLKKFLLLKDLFFRIDAQNYRYEISDQIFVDEKNLITKDEFFKSIQKIFNSAVYSNILLGEYCSGIIKPEDFDKSKNIGMGFSLYT
ncbi:MAG: DUF2299 family protein [Candidatus Lokiarchaeota archaeon]